LSGLRISGGELRGRPLQGPKGSDDLRPTTERVREAIFSILGDVTGATVLDLFCGTGALGLEAVSRGAQSAVLVDRRAATVRRNVEELGLEERVEVVAADASRYLRRSEQASFDLVFCDPPYKLADRLAGELDPLIRAVLAEDGRVVVETSPDPPLQLALPLLKERRYGDTLIRVHASGGAEASR
jgi:16S rRNA (guanine966-N2)-methyltransferase